MTVFLFCYEMLRDYAYTYIHLLLLPQYAEREEVRLMEFMVLFLRREGVGVGLQRTGKDKKHMSCACMDELMEKMAYTRTVAAIPNKQSDTYR